MVIYLIPYSVLYVILIFILINNKILCNFKCTARHVSGENTWIGRYMQTSGASQSFRMMVVCRLVEGVGEVFAVEFPPGIWDVIKSYIIDISNNTLSSAQMTGYQDCMRYFLYYTVRTTGTRTLFNCTPHFC